MSKGLTLQDYVTELCTPVTHREHYTRQQHNNDGTTTWIGGDHTTHNAALITQLWDAVEASGSSEKGARAAFVSKPTARIEALDAGVRIDLAASRWVRDLGEDDPQDTIGCILRLNGLAASTHNCRHKPKRNKSGTITCCTFHAIESDVRSWWVQARILTGWDQPAWQPDNTCPLCGIKGGLRVRVEEKLATCTKCHESWDDTTIGLLADHIRHESTSREPVSSTKPWCWCPWPQELVIARAGTCPDCGSWYCDKALDQIVTKLVRHAAS